MTFHIIGPLNGDYIGHRLFLSQRITSFDAFFVVSLLNKQSDLKRQGSLWRHCNVYIQCVYQHKVCFRVWQKHHNSVEVQLVSTIP